MKKIPLLSWLFLIFSISSTLSNTNSMNMLVVSGHCLKDQQSLLLRLKDSLVFDGASVLVKWNHSSDCCSWEGVTCEEGQVTGLKISNGSISGGIDENSALFDLVYLKSLDLSFNFDMNSEIPSRIGNLTNLSYLNFSNAGFVGQVPKEISRLTRLVTLDLSNRFSWRYLEIQDLRLLVQNLTQLEELYLDRANVLAPEYEWGQTLSSSLPKLRVLSLSLCHLYGPIHPSLAKLKSLSVIRLDGNNLTAPVPAFFSNFTNLTSLLLKGCGLYGPFPKEIFQVRKLRILDISKNKFLHGSLPEFPSDSDIQSLVITSTNFSGILPASIGNLRLLSGLELADCHFSGTLHSLTKLTQLVYLDLSDNNFTGPIPSFNMSKNLTQLDLSNNRLTGPISSTQWEGLLNLVEIHLKNNSLIGDIPSSLFSLPSLQIIDLSYNQFSGQILEFPKAEFSMLNSIDLSNNNLQGPIPISIFKLKDLKHLSLSSNNFSGTIQLDMIQGLTNLVSLELSYNNLSVNASGNGSNLSFLPKLTNLLLASCNLGIFPDLKNQSNLQFLDLSDNQIFGEIPSWIWNVGNGSLISLNLSNNHLIGMQEPYSIPNQLDVLDLHSNQLYGKIPTLPSESFYVDLSKNGFTSSIPADVGNNLSSTMFFSLSNNNLTGVIPESICNAATLQVLDLSNNGLNGRIPTCMLAMTQIFGLNLRNNNLGGKIPDSFPIGCSLHTLDFNGNFLTGRFPKSLSLCKAMEFIDVGNNQMFDTFPLSLKQISTLRVLILRSNSFHGHITCGENIGAWPIIQIVDVASNNFSGELPGQCLTKWHAMMDTKTKLDHLSFEFTAFIPFPYYENVVTVTNKGLQMELVKILTAFTSIDFSSNKFQRQIPKELGQLKSLLVLNLSNNVLSGQIPSSFGNLGQLESLDLSRNHLNGTIPQSLSVLNFLSLMNLSHNQLVGRIPSGNQIQTFSADCFQGNEGLCGPPLIVNCPDGHVPGKLPKTPNKDKADSKSGIEIEWNLLSAEVGFFVGFGSVIWSLVFWKRWRNWYFNGAEDIAFSILPQPLLRKWILWKVGKPKPRRNRGRRAI